MWRHGSGSGVHKAVAEITWSTLSCLLIHNDALNVLSQPGQICLFHCQSFIEIYPPPHLYLSLIYQWCASPKEALLCKTLLWWSNSLTSFSMWFTCYREVLQLVTGMQLRWTLNTFLHDNLSMFASLGTPRSIPITQWQWDKERVQRLFSRVVTSMSAPPNTLSCLVLKFPNISAMLSSFELLF